MAEVKTYKCDICGEIYHREENDTHFMTIVEQPLDEDTTKRFEYQYICDDCMDNVHRIIDNPKILDNMISANDDYRGYISGYKNHIRRIHDTIFKYRSFWDISNNPNDYDTYIDNVIEEIKMYKAMELVCKKREKIIIVLSIILGIVVAGLIVALAS